MSASKFVAVSDLGSSHAGAIVWWRLAGALRADDLAWSWAQAALPEKWLPGATTPRAALGIAVREITGPRRLARPLGEGAGYVIVDESPDHANGLLQHRPVGVVRVEEGRIIVSGEAATESMRRVLEDAYDAAMASLAQGAVGGWLASLVGKLHGVPLRDTGGVYFVPRAHVETLSAIAGALRAASAHVVHTVPALRSEEAVAAILAAVQDDATSAALALEEKIAAGELGARGLRTVQAHVAELREKVSTYEALLGVSLEAMRARLADLDASSTLAIIAAESEAA